MLAATLALALALGAGRARATPAPRPLGYDAAIALLQQPKRWCEAAAALVRIGERRAIAPLYRVAARSEEGLPDRACVRDALARLGVHDEAARLVASPDAGDRRAGLRMMADFEAVDQVPILARLALHDPDPALRALAGHTLRVQPITAAWDAAMIALLDAGDGELRALAAASLAYRFDVAIAPALRKRLASEPESAVRTALGDALRVQADHAGR